MKADLLERLKAWAEHERGCNSDLHAHEDRAATADALVAAWEWIEADAPIVDDQDAMKLECFECAARAEKWEDVRHVDYCPYGQARAALERLLEEE